VILEQAAVYGIHLQLVLLWHQALRTYTGVPVVLPEGMPRPDVSADWDNNPYNVLNGGILSGPSVFLFNEQAQTLFRQRLRYIVARWGYSPEVFAWEIIDQMDRVANYDPTVAKSWLQSTASYLRQIDTQGHLITASSREYDLATADNPLLDFSSAQFYQRRPIESVGDQVLNVADTIQSYRESGYGPVLLAAYSLNPWFEPTADDPTGVHFQNSLWAAVFSGAAGGAMSDWWDTYVIPQGLMRYYRPLAAFAAGVDWAGLDLQPAQAGLLTEDVGLYQPVRLSNFRRQFAARPESVVTRTITADGLFPDLSDVPSFIYGQVFNAQFSQVQRYRVTLPIDTYLEVGIRAVSSQAGARLVVEVDSSNVVEVDLRAGSRDVKVRVPVTAGDHTITLDNLGDDWLELEAVEIGQLIVPARSLTLRDSKAGVAFAWLQHRDYTWDRVASGEGTEPISLEYRLGGMPAGRYVAEIWDPLTGAVLGEELLRVREDGLLALQLLPLTRQLAVRAIRQPDLPTPTPPMPTVSTVTATSTPVRTVATATPVPTETANMTATPPSTAAVQPTRTRTPVPSPGGTTTSGSTRTPAPRSSPLATLVPFVASTNTPRPESTVTQG
ncbi:MAG: hypothetical protein K8J31_11665, partial [Anaerolineae bacterium]|nr:hypothetical protein [Anaerolineae bacterium]